MARISTGINEKFGSLVSIPGLKKIALLFGGCLLIWGSSFYFLQQKQDLVSRISLQERRFGELLELAREYKSISVPMGQEDPSIWKDQDPIEIISSTLEKVGLKANLVQLSVLSSGVNVQLERLYGEDLGTFIQQIRLKGLEISSAEIKGLPDGDGLLFTLSMIVEKKS